MAKIRRFGIVGALALLPLACQEGNPTETVPPVAPPPHEGIGEVFGTVTLADGQSAGVMWMQLLDCEPPFPSNWWSSMRTDEDGSFRHNPVWTGDLPSMPEDTVGVRCLLRVDGNWASASVEVIYTRPEDERIPVRVDLQEGDTVPLGDSP